MTSRVWLVGSLLLATSAAACSGARAGEPAWPKSHVAEVDGGESLAPRPKTQIAAAVAISDDKTPAVVEAPVVPVVAPAPGSAAVIPTTVAPEDVITTEEMVIEVDE